MFDNNFSFARNRLLRFLVVGGVNTLFGFAIYGISILAGKEVWLALLIGMLCGTVFNFFTIGGHVFRELSPARIPRFFICYLLVYGINVILFKLISLWTSNKILSQAIIMIPLALFSYFLMSRFVFFKEASNSPSKMVMQNKD